MTPLKWMALTALLAACQTQTSLVAAPPATGTDDVVEQPTGTDPVEEMQLVGDLSIDKISIYQGIESILWDDGAPATTQQAPIVAKRDALVRVFVDPKSGWDPRKVEAVLTIDTDGDIVELSGKKKIEDSSKSNDIDSTINVEIAAGVIKTDSTFHIELYEVSADGSGGGATEDVVWDSEEQAPLDIVQSDKLEIVLIPVKYNYDGSGRLPDTSETQVQRIRDLAYGMYPAKDVEVRVGATLNWSKEIEPFNEWDWVDILDQIGRMRDSANEAPNTYYYGMFEPEGSLNSFCQQGCILGLSLLAFSPSDPYFRASVGIGYSGMTSVETLVHEVGHAHGREHAPCGLYGQPSDSRYPYKDGNIGKWGYDIVKGELMPPNSTMDMMSYCGPIWVSDYTYYSLLERIQDVKVQPRSAMIQWPAMTLGEDGTVVRREPVPASQLDGALQVQVAVYDEADAYVETRDGHLFPYSHFDSGLLILEQDLPEGWTAEVLD